LPCTPFSRPGVSGVSGRAAWREDIYDDCLQELRWLYDRRSVEEARRDLAAWIAKWEGRYPRLVAWAEETIEETLTFYRLPRQHHKHLKSTNMLERLNEEIRRRTSVVRIFPNAASCCRLVRALATHTIRTKDAPVAMNGTDQSDEAASHSGLILRCGGSHFLSIRVMASAHA
jgi:transposase-like protein